MWCAWKQSKLVSFFDLNLLIISVVGNYSIDITLFHVSIEILPLIQFCLGLLLLEIELEPCPRDII